MAKVVLITGASAGIGAATALKLAEKGFDLILTARREDRLEDVAKKAREKGARNVLAKKLDVRDLKSIESFFESSDVKAMLLRLEVLVNNAGVAKGVDGADKAKIEDWEMMVETNVLGLMYMTRFALPFIKDNRGHIVNIGSVAGRWSYPGGGVYCATKAAIRAFTEGLRMDLLGTRVRVTNIAPGMAETEFSIVRFQSVDLAKKVYENFTALTAEDIAECIEWSISRPSHVNIQEMIIYPTDQAGSSHLYRETRDV